MVPGVSLPPGIALMKANSPGGKTTPSYRSFTWGILLELVANFCETERNAREKLVRMGKPFLEGRYSGEHNSVVWKRVP